LSKMKHRRDDVGFLGPSTLRVYIELVKIGKPIGVRELQRRLGFKSPSTIKYHLDRLESMGLVRKTVEGYVARSEKPGILSTYTSLLGFMVPRLIPFAAGLTVATIIYVVLSYPHIDYGLLILLITSISILWIEGFRMYRWLRRITRR